MWYVTQLMKKNPSWLNDVMKTASKEKKSPEFRADGWKLQKQ